MSTRISLPVTLPRVIDLEPRAIGQDIAPDAVYTFTEHGAAICAAICDAGRHNFDRRAGNVCVYLPVAAPTPDALADALRYRIGRKAAYQQWDAWMDALHAEGRAARTVATLLAIPEARKLCLAALAAGKAYTADAEYHATRQVVRAAIVQLATRTQRRKDRASAESARKGTANAIGIQLAAKRTKQQADADAQTAAAVKAAKKGLYRTSKSGWAGGGHATTVHVGEKRWTSHDRSGRAVGASGESEKAWSSNGKWSGSNSSHEIQVPRDWLTVVQARGIAVCDGLLTLDAEPILGHGPELFRAAWIEQGKGFDLNCVRGYIARIDGAAYHAKTARAALDGVQRKAGLKPKRRQGVIDLDKLARRHGDLPVYFADSRDAGNCDSGTRSWCNAVGVNPAGCTLADVVSGYKLRPLPGALAVIRRVVRDRHNRQPLDLSALNGAAKLLSDGRIVFDSEGGFRVENN